jgi:hypothetical protein
MRELKKVGISRRILPYREGKGIILVAWAVSSVG